MMSTPKIAVYTIALNEEKHVERWYQSAREADLLLIADTGSTDNTVSLAEALNISVHHVEVKPWRFDVARNASLALIPDDFDICIQLDMDEVLPFGWRNTVEKAWKCGNTWPIYKQVMTRYPDGRPRDYLHYFKIHPRSGFVWKYPVHEIITPMEGISYKREEIDLEVDHLQDHSKSRTSYLELLEKAVEETPNDWRMAHYLNREFHYRREALRVLQTAYSALKIQGGWDVERASTCIWASNAAIQLNLIDLALSWSKKATEEAPMFFEAWHWDAHVNHLLKNWSECFHSASKILVLTRGHHHLVKPEVWDWGGWDLLALSSHFLGRNDLALLYGERAALGAPNDQRITNNLAVYKSVVQGQIAEQSSSEENSKNLKNEFSPPIFPRGGTELMHEQLLKWCDISNDDFNLIVSNCDKKSIDPSRINILWQHHNIDQIAVQGLRDSKFVDSLDAIVFVSEWQHQQFLEHYSLPRDKCYVIKNAIESVLFAPQTKANSETVKMVYSSTPWRGLDVLLDAYTFIKNKNCELHIYSSTAIYGQDFYKENESKWENLFRRAKEMEGVVYHGYVPNEVLRAELNNYDIFTYPSTWAETFCVSAAEAGFAGLRLLVTDLGALPEICGVGAHYIPYDENRDTLVKSFAHGMDQVIDEVRSVTNPHFRKEQHERFENMYAWSNRRIEWDALFEKLKSRNR